MAQDAQRGEQLLLRGEPGSVGLARTFVRTRLEEARRPDWVDAATLAVSELVTNSVLHAHSDIQLRVLVKEDHVRIEVWDRSPSLPMPRSHNATATTGRGLELVATVSFEHGVEALGEEGKIVWCCVNSEISEPAVAMDFALEEWADLSELTADIPAQGGPDDLTVVLLGLPPTLWLAAREHHDALLRELALVQASLPPEKGRALQADLAAADRARSHIGDAVVSAIELARKVGTASVPLPDRHPGELPSVPSAVDLEVRVGRDEVPLFARLQDVLDHGERLAQGEQLLVRPGLPEIVGVRDWACEQIIAQAAGSPGARWPGVDDERFGAAEIARSSTGWSDEVVRQAETGLIAVDDANRIVAVSPRLLELVGWREENLVGRRVVAIVPPRFREAHVAGFSRHLSTGVARALDVPLRLPVLCADGSEVECAFLIQAERTPSGRTMYVAQIEPV